MDSLITAAALALAAGNPLGALKRVALRNDAPGLPVCASNTAETVAILKSFLFTERSRSMSSFVRMG